MVGDEEYKYWYGATDRHCRWTMAGRAAPLSRLALAAGRRRPTVGRGRRPSSRRLGLPGLANGHLQRSCGGLADAAPEPVVLAQEVGDPVPVEDHGLPHGAVGSTGTRQSSLSM